MLQVTSLKPDTSYVFLVRARNSQGLSVPSPFSDVARTTNFDQHAIPQTELVRARDRLNSEILYLKDVQPLSSTSVKIVWDVSVRRAKIGKGAVKVENSRPRRVTSLDSRSFLRTRSICFAISIVCYLPAFDTLQAPIPQITVYYICIHKLFTFLTLLHLITPQ